MNPTDDVDALFTLPVEEFVSARDQLARSLRSEGDRTSAKQVAELRRPTVAAWGLNQLVRRHAERVNQLIEAGAALAHAQQRALDGERDSGIRQATADRRHLLDELVAATAGILSESGRNPAPHTDAIAATLEAATVDPDAADQLRAGRLARELPLPAGFGDLTAFSALAALPQHDQEDAQEPDGKAEADPDAIRRAELEHALAEAQERADSAEQDASKAREKAKIARNRADETADRADQLEIQLAEARREATRARTQAREAEDAANRMRATADERIAEVEAIREELAP